MNARPPTTPPGRQSGLTLVEILVAMAVGLFLVAGIIQLFVSSSQIYRTQDALSRLQENGRFALEHLARELRHGGFKGACLPAMPFNNLLDPAGVGYSDDLFNLNQAIVGWDNSAGPHAADMDGYQAGTDTFIIKHAAAASGATASGNTPANANTINLTAASGVPQGAIVIVSDPEGCDAFQNRANANANTLTRGAGGQPGNLNPGTNDFSKGYGADMEIWLLRATLYYVGTGASGQPALRQIRYDLGAAQDEELIESVRDMQILYGVDNAAPPNQAINQYVTADLVADWNQVVAVRISLLLASTENNVVDAPMSLAYNGGVFIAPDRRMYQVFTTTVGLRNRLP